MFTENILIRKKNLRNNWKKKNENILREKNRMFVKKKKKSNNIDV